MDDVDLSLKRAEVRRRNNFLKGKDSKTKLSARRAETNVAVNP